MIRQLANELNGLVSESVTIMGWVHSRRNHGSVTFLDIRDRTGLVQVVVLPGLDFTKMASEISIESVVKIQGEVVKRPSHLTNEKIVSGQVEIQARGFEVISKSDNLPFELSQTSLVNEETRLKHRYLDLRSPRMAANIKLRSETLKFVIDFLTNKGFTYIQTPILSKSTPEGARDFLVPSRLQAGKFFALPQSPQQYKQLLMVAGIERYFQIAPCFRDEDARADRSPGEFYQIDIEMSFVDQDDVLALVEEMMIELVKKVSPHKKITLTPFPKLSYDDAIKRYKSDKPDLRRDPNNMDELAFAWIVDFPLFTKQSKDDFFHGSGKSHWAPSHHMFTMPKYEDMHLLDSDPGSVKSYQHDLILNGIEVGGGSIRIHDPIIQQKIWDLIGFTASQKEQFSHLITAFKYGVPPHGGIAPGFDRIISILAGENNIREVIAFPLSGEAKDPLTDAPSTVEKHQLDELGIELKKIKSHAKD